MTEQTTELAVVPHMTVRQYYKAAALQGISANQYFFGISFQQQPAAAAAFAAEAADAMIAEDLQFESKA